MEDISEITKKRDDLKKLISDTEELFKEWSTMSLQKIELSGKIDIADSDREVLRNLSDELKNKETLIAQKILNLSQMLDFGPFSLETPFSELQKEFPTIKRLGTQAIQKYENQIAEEEKKKDETTLQKRKELQAITLEIDKLKRVQRDQILQTATQLGGYIFLFFGIYLAKIFSLRLVKRF